jgi:hypothetical protein
MKLIQYGLSADPEVHAYFYLGDAENLKLATEEQKFPVNYFPELNVDESDALEMFRRHGVEFLIDHRPKVYVSELFPLNFTTLFFTGKKIFVKQLYLIIYL